ncbi:MAG: type II toxin-antitoxin system RelE/ParE family toxin [Verrucomicrobia bacterium]|nr:type II toxin-antitoxin system RelE/ParE family toxin [Verrucomicrobiota bacterium]
MASFEIRWRASTKKDLRRIAQQEVTRILDAVATLGHEPLPHGSEKLTGSEHTYRIRLGDYRVVYELLRGSGVIEIQRVRHRRDVYRR